MLKDVLEAERAERKQEADCALIDAAVRLAEKKIAFFEGRQLDPDELRKKWCAIRDRTILVVRDVRRNIVRRANEAKETERWIIEKWFREKSDDSVLSELSSTLEQVPTKGLLAYLPYLIEVGDLARIQCVCMVFATRHDHQQYKVSFDKVLTQFVLNHCGVMGERLARILHSAGQVDGGSGHRAGDRGSSQ
jgi:hypothetical protein